MNHFLNYFTETEYQKLKAIDDMYEKALKIVKRVFVEKLDKGGKPYINHLCYVSDHVNQDVEKIVGLLHDIVEDTKITFSDLQNIGFNQEVIEAIKLVTRRKTESYSNYINRIIKSNNLTVLNVKIVDMENNMDLSRIPNPTKKDYQRNEKKYIPQYRKLIEELERRNNKNARYKVCKRK